MSKINFDTLAKQLVLTAQRAGRVQLDIYASDFSVDYKSDESPVSQADILSEKLILEDLARIAPEIPVLAEEAVSMGTIPELGDLFFCVDPLDGTKEFVQKNDEFTVNIALIKKGVPVFGIVYVPVSGQLYLTLASDKAMQGVMDAYQEGLSFEQLDLLPIHVRAAPSDGLLVMVSRSHMSAATHDFLKEYSVGQLKSAGSSLKFCLVAAGEADLYPRLTPTMFWDSAAGHAIVLAAGGVVQTMDGRPLRYVRNSQSDTPFLNPSFVVRGQSV